MHIGESNHPYYTHFTVSGEGICPDSSLFKSQPSLLKHLELQKSAPYFSVSLATWPKTPPPHKYKQMCIWAHTHTHIHTRSAFSQSEVWDYVRIIYFPPDKKTSEWRVKEHLICCICCVNSDTLVTTDYCLIILIWFATFRLLLHYKLSQHTLVGMLSRVRTLLLFLFKSLYTVWKIIVCSWNFARVCRFVCGIKWNNHF